MDVDAIGGAFGKACQALPFYQGVKAARMAAVGNTENIYQPFAITCAYAAVIYVLAVWAFRSRMQRDIR